MTDTQDAPFNPADHNVDDVLAHVRDHPDEAEAIVLAEVDGKNRSTLIEALAPDDGLGDDEIVGDNVEPDGGEDDGDVDPEVDGFTYTLQPGDNPAVVARLLLGRGSYGNLIVRANPGVKWKPGVEIVIPEVD